MLLLLVMALVFAAVAVRLTDIQVISRQRYASYGQAETVHTVKLPALRGTIYGASGSVLAMSVPEKTIIADDLQISDPAKEARQLAPLLGKSESTIQATLSEHSGFVYVARQVSDTAAEKIQALNLPGLTFRDAPKRFDPAGDLASAVIGQVNSKGLGYTGLEAQYNKLLTGHPGSEVVQMDPYGRVITGGTERTRAAVPGTGIVTTLDPSMQYETQQALAAEMASSHATAGWAVVLDARTGDILALAGQVAGGPGGAGIHPSSRALALTNVYEPGSVAKVATFAGALTDGLVTPGTVIDVPAQIDVGGATFTDAEPHGDEQLTSTQILERSSNIGTIEVAKMLGPDRLYHWLRAIGWGSSPGLGFPGTSPGLLRPPSSWSGSAMGSMPIGQAEAISALQMADAYNMVANGGVYVPPRLVTATVGPDGMRHPTAAPARHRVVSPLVASQLTSMLETVVSSKGTAPAAEVPGYVVAGKTGTAQIPLTNGRGYQPGAFMASFVGFAPASDPAITVAVTLSHPAQKYGGTVAAPVFSQIAGYALRQLDVPPTSTTGGGAPGTTIGRSASAGRGR